MPLIEHLLVLNDQNTTCLANKRAFIYSFTVIFSLFFHDFSKKLCLNKKKHFLSR